MLFVGWNSNSRKEADFYGFKLQVKSFICPLCRTLNRSHVRLGKLLVCKEFLKFLFILNLIEYDAHSFVLLVCLRVYFKVLECCHYLNHHNMSRNKDSDAGLVTLLTGQSWADSNEFSPVGVAKAVGRFCVLLYVCINAKEKSTNLSIKIFFLSLSGIAVEHIESFFAKWKTSSKSHG